MANTVKLDIEQVNPGQQVEVQLAPPGAYNQIVEDDDAEGGKKVITQIVDQEAIDRLVRNFKDDVLVDADHNSEKDGGSTEAQAWVKSLRNDPDRGLVAVFEFTDVGAEAVNGKRYRYVSPAWTMGEDGRPEKLVSVGMTNKPNLPVAPVLNMRAISNTAEGGAESPAQTETGSAAKAATNGNPSPADVQQKEHNMDKIKEVLGLPPEATDEDVLAAIQALATKVGDMEAAQNAAEAEQFAEENKDKVEDPEVLKNCYLKDKEMAKAIVANCRKAQVIEKPVVKTVVNAKQADEPKVVVNSAVEGMKACKTPEEMNAFITANAAALMK